MEITINAKNPVRTLRGGIGASWHAISQGARDGSAGSSWGGNPPASETGNWEEIYRLADWLGLNWIRVEIEQRSYRPERDCFTWESEDMLALRRILDWCQSRGADVILQQMWGNVEWNAYPGVDALHSAPHDIDAYAESIALLIEKLIRYWSYTCVKWVCINNEPERHFSWWQGHGRQPLKIAPGIKATREALDRHNLSVPIVGPDYTGMEFPITSAAECNEWLGAFDLHSYTEEFHLCPVGMPESDRKLKAWVDFANSKGKPFFLTEVGSMKYGWNTDSPAPGGYFANLSNVEIILRALRLGVEGFNRWSFNNRGDLDGQWQLVDTWDTKNNALLPAFRPHPNAYWLYGLLTRFFKKYSTLLDTHVDGIIRGWQQYLLCETLRSPDGNLNIFVLCHTEQEQPLTLHIEGLDTPLSFHRYRITEVIRNRTENVRIDADASYRLADSSASIEDIAPGLSFTVYSTRLLAHEENP